MSLRGRKRKNGPDQKFWKRYVILPKYFFFSCFFFFFQRKKKKPREHVFCLHFGCREELPMVSRTVLKGYGHRACWQSAGQTMSNRTVERDDDLVKQPLDCSSQLFSCPVDGCIRQLTPLFRQCRLTKLYGQMLNRT